mmetsp:Transcript_18262/g.41664  ORF Transcript_18262/g.41664 Transcript_18262/m.41664 type:complete len:137 (+) Transcript_18262:2706-3116(+)
MVVTVVLVVGVTSGVVIILDCVVVVAAVPAVCGGVSHCLERKFSTLYYTGGDLFNTPRCRSWSFSALKRILADDDAAARIVVYTCSGGPERIFFRKTNDYGAILEKKAMIRERICNLGEEGVYLWKAGGGMERTNT